MHDGHLGRVGTYQRGRDEPWQNPHGEERNAATQPTKWRWHFAAGRRGSVYTRIVQSKEGRTKIIRAGKTAVFAKAWLSPGLPPARSRRDMAKPSRAKKRTEHTQPTKMAVAPGEAGRG